METQKMTITVEADVPAKLAELAGGERKIGKFITDTARAFHSQDQIVADDLNTIQLLLGALAGKSKLVSARLDQHDARLTRLEAAQPLIER